MLRLTCGRAWTGGEHVHAVGDVCVRLVVREQLLDDELASLDSHHPRSPTSKFHSLQSPPTIPHFVIRSIPQPPSNLPPKETQNLVVVKVLETVSVTWAHAMHTYIHGPERSTGRGEGTISAGGGVRRQNPHKSHMPQGQGQGPTKPNQEQECTTARARSKEMIIYPQYPLLARDGGGTPPKE